MRKKEMYSDVKIEIEQPNNRRLAEMENFPFFI